MSDTQANQMETLAQLAEELSDPHKMKAAMKEFRVALSKQRARIRRQRLINKSKRVWSKVWRIATLVGGTFAAAFAATFFLASPAGQAAATIMAAFLSAVLIASCVMIAYAALFDPIGMSSSS
jgi:hypothetical protein